MNEPYSGNATCRECGSTDVVVDRKGRSKVYRCKKCGNVWTGKVILRRRNKK